MSTEPQPLRTPTGSSDSSQRQLSGCTMVKRDGVILELKKPRIFHPRHLYQRDVLKWGVSFSGSSSRFGFHLRDGKVVNRVPASTMDDSGTDFPYGLLKFNIPLLPHPVHNPYHDPLPPWEDHEVDVYDLCAVSQYTTTVGIPGDLDETYFDIQPDTGSSTLWLCGEELDIKDISLAPRFPLRTCYYPGPVARHHEENTFRVQQHNQLVAKGTVYEDTWNLTTHDGAVLDLRMSFGVVQEVNPFLSRSCIDGILGLSIVPTNKEASPLKDPDHFLTALHAHGVIPSLIFCICFNKRGRSFLSLGCIPEDIPVPRHWISVIPGSIQWLLPCHAIGWGVSPTHSQFEDLTFSVPIEVLIDSGTTYCFFSDEVLAFVYHRLYGKASSNGYLIPNRRPAGIEPKRIWINLGGEWMLWPRDSLYGRLLTSKSHSSDAWYDGVLKSQGDDFPFAILGADFFEGQYVYFDADPSAPKVAFETRPPDVKPETKTEPMIVILT